MLYLTIKTLRRLHPDQVDVVDSEPSLFSDQGWGKAGDDVTAMLMMERDVATAAFNRALGSAIVAQQLNANFRSAAAESNPQAQRESAILPLLPRLTHAADEWDRAAASARDRLLWDNHPQLEQAAPWVRQPWPARRELGPWQPAPEPESEIAEWTAAPPSSPLSTRPAVPLLPATLIRAT